MTRPFAGTTLMDIVLSKLRASDIPNENTYVSIFEKELYDISERYPVNIFKRSEASSLSEGQNLTEIFEWWNKIPHKYVIIVNACCPFLSVDTLNDFYNEYLKTDKSGMFAVMEKKNYFWNNEGEFLSSLGGGQLNTKTAHAVKEAAHCLYAGSLENIGKGIWMGDLSNKGEVKLYTMPEREALDIDESWQFVMCSEYYAKVEKMFYSRGEK